MIFYTFMRLCNGHGPSKLLLPVGNGDTLASVAMKQLYVLRKYYNCDAYVALYERDTVLVEMAMQLDLYIAYLDPQLYDETVDERMLIYHDAFKKMAATSNELMVYINACMPFMRHTTLRSAVDLAMAEDTPLPLRHAMRWPAPVWNHHGTRMTHQDTQIISTAAGPDNYIAGHGFQVHRRDDLWACGAGREVQPGRRIIPGHFYHGLLVTPASVEFTDAGNRSDANFVEWLGATDWRAWFREQPHTPVELITFDHHESVPVSHPQ